MAQDLNSEILDQALTLLAERLRREREAPCVWSSVESLR